MQPFTSDSVSTAPSPSIRPPSENEAGKGIIIHYNRDINCFNPMRYCNQTCAEHSTNSAMTAVSAVSLLLNITLATVILIQCLLMLKRKRPKDMLHSTNDETYAEPTKQVDVSTAPNEAYGLHKITKPSEEDTTYEMVK